MTLNIDMMIPLSPFLSSSELLLDEERPEVGELPGASGRKNNNLNDDPANDAGIGSF